MKYTGCYWSDEINGTITLNNKKKLISLIRLYLKHKNLSKDCNWMVTETNAWEIIQSGVVKGKGV